MNDYISGFWEWANISPAQYAQHGLSREEGDYPHFKELTDYAERIINSDQYTAQEIEEVLLIMALDNEDEDILDYLTAHCSEDKLEQVVMQGMMSIQPNARWQIAELIYRRTPAHFKEYLLMLSQDPDSYVRKRANNLLNYMEGI